MNLIPLLWGLAVGLVVGVVLAWMLFRLKSSQKISEAIQP